jgi:predicted CXXCH cytochrome family protein
MASFRATKTALVVGLVLGLLLWASSGSHSQSDQKKAQARDLAPGQEGADYVGTDTCQTCHEAQANHFARTIHAKLSSDPSWKNHVTGCEACHGPGSKHVELMADATDGKAAQPTGHRAIRSLKQENEPSKMISETCLSCHSGKEEHNNFRRGEHWRNNVGCTDCHAAHEPLPGPSKPGSHTLIADSPGRRIDTAVLRLLKDNETSLCLGCHTEQKAQFTMPFHHKVLEGIIKCSDCHNPHGGFENKQQRLTTGTDAACNKCHTDKQGPFVFEHSPVRVEGCAICHQPHGSSNPKLLTRSHVFQLCIECHTNAHQLVLREDGEGAPAPPGFHNLTQERIRNCTTCHTAIHGSNNHNFFFR